MDFQGLWGLARLLVLTAETFLEVSEFPDYNRLNPIEDEKDEGGLNSRILALLKAEKLPPALWPETAVEIQRLLRKKSAAGVERPLWNERHEHPALAKLSAPEFLKHVWADQIAEDGSIEKVIVRQTDSSLMANVEKYLENRKRRKQDAGDAAGLRLIARPMAPRGTPNGKNI